MHCMWWWDAAWISFKFYDFSFPNFFFFRFSFLCNFGSCFRKDESALRFMSKKVPGFCLGWGLSEWSLYDLHVPAWAFYHYSCFLSQYIDTHVRLSDDSKLTIGASVSMHGCQSVLNLWWIGNLYRLCPASLPKLAAIGCSYLENLNR